MREKRNKSPEGSGGREGDSERSNCVFVGVFVLIREWRLSGGRNHPVSPVLLAFDAFLGRFLLPLPLLVP